MYFFVCSHTSRLFNSQVTPIKFRLPLIGYTIDLYVYVCIFVSKLIGVSHKSKFDELIT